MEALDEETLFVGTAEAEHVEMYLKAIWHIKERGGDVKISTIAKMLNVRQPSVVQMLKKLNLKNLVNYNKAGVFLTEEGESAPASKRTSYFSTSLPHLEYASEMEPIFGPPNSRLRKNAQESFQMGLPF